METCLQKMEESNTNTLKVKTLESPVSQNMTKRKTNSHTTQVQLYQKGGDYRRTWRGERSR